MFDVFTFSEPQGQAYLSFKSSLLLVLLVLFINSFN